MPWTETTIGTTQNDTLATMIDSVKGNLLRLQVPGFPFSVSILLGCFNLLLSPTSFLTFLIILSLSSVV